MVNSEGNLEKEIKQLIAEEFGFDIEHISRLSRLQEDLGLDSIDTVELALQVEDKYNIEIPDKDIEKATTVGYLVDYVQNYKK